MVQRSKIFSGGDHGPQDQGSYTVQIDSPADDILAQSRIIQQNWKAKTRQERAYANEHLRHLENNYRIEREYHHKSFKFAQEDNKLVKNAILKNLEQEYKNIDARARSNKLQTDAIQSIIGIGQDYAQQQALKQKALEKDKATKLAQSVNNDLTVQPEIEALEELGAKEFSKEGMKETLIKAGFDPDKVNDFVKKGPREYKLLLEALKREQANNVALLVQPLKSLSNIPWNGNTYNYAQLIELAKTADGDGTKQILALAQNSLKGTLLEKYKNNPYLGEKFDAHASKDSMGVYKAKGAKAHTKALEEGLKISYQALYSRFNAEDGDTRHSAQRTFNDHESRRPVNISPKDWNAKFLEYARFALDTDKMTLDQYHDIRKIVTKHKGKQEKGGSGELQKVLLREVADFTQVDAAAQRKRLRDAKAGALENTTIKGLGEKTFQNYTQLINDRQEGGIDTDNEDHMLAARKLIETNRPENILAAKKIIGTFVKGQGSATHLMETITDEIVATRMLQNPASVDEEYIRSLPGVSSIWKRNKIEELNKNGGSIPEAIGGIRIRESYNKARTDVGKQLGNVVNAFTPKGFEGTTSTSNAMQEARLDFDRRVKLKVTTEINKLGDGPISDAQLAMIWQDAIAHAQGQFKDEMIDGENGKGKYARSKEVGKLNEYPYFMPASSEQYHGPTKFRQLHSHVQANGGSDDVLFAYLSNPETRVVQSDRLTAIANNGLNGGGYPKIIEEISIKYRVPEKAIFQALVNGENQRRLDRKEKELTLEDALELSRKTADQIGEGVVDYSEVMTQLKWANDSLPSVCTAPYDPSCSAIAYTHIALGGDWSKAFYGGGVAPYLYGLFQEDGPEFEMSRVGDEANE